LRTGGAQSQGARWGGVQREGAPEDDVEG